MWALEYDPDLFSLYEEPEGVSEKVEGSRGKPKSIRQCGKFERENMKNKTNNSEAPLPISIFLVASVLKDKSTKLLQEARGLDDVVKVNHLFTCNAILFPTLFPPLIMRNQFNRYLKTFIYKFAG